MKFVLIAMALMILFNKAYALEYGNVKSSDILAIAEFKNRYEQFQISADKIEQIAKALKGLKIEVYFGDWCPDSVENVPPFIKIIEKIGLKEINISYINVPKDKSKRPALLKEKNIERLPTFVFYKDNKEVGRIIEHPIPNLEDNIIELFGKSVN